MIFFRKEEERRHPPPFMSIGDTRLYTNRQSTGDVVISSPAALRTFPSTYFSLDGPRRPGQSFLLNPFLNGVKYMITGPAGKCTSHCPAQASLLYCWVFFEEVHKLCYNCLNTEFYIIVDTHMLCCNRLNTG